MQLIGELFLDLAGSHDPVVARLYVPQQRPDGAWVCRTEVGAPINHSLNAIGETNLQALAIGLSILSTVLYTSWEYREGQLGWNGSFGGYLSLPVSKIVDRVGPYPF